MGEISDKARVADTDFLNSHPVSILPIPLSLQGVQEFNQTGYTHADLLH